MFYIHAVVPDTYNILGVTLKPYCIGHYLLMMKYNCSVVNYDVNSVHDVASDISDILLALSICSRTYEEFIDYVNGYHYERSFFGFGGYTKVYDPSYFTRYNAKWGKALKKACKNKDFNLLQHIEVFKRYMDDGCAEPSFAYDDNDNGDISGSHWTQNILNVLTSECGYTHSEAINLPLTLAFADFYKFIEKNGGGRLISDKEKEIIKHGRN